MAFDAEKLGAVDYTGGTDGTAHRTHVYITDDTHATVEAAGYFLEAGTDSSVGQNKIAANDVIRVKSSVDGLKTYRVSDAAAGTVVAFAS